MLLESRIIFVASQIQENPSDIKPVTIYSLAPEIENLLADLEGFKEALPPDFFRPHKPLFSDDRLNRFADLAGQLLGDIPTGTKTQRLRNLLEQLDETARYAVLFDLIMEVARLRGQNETSEKMRERFMVTVTQINAGVRVH